MESLTTFDWASVSTEAVLVLFSAAVLALSVLISKRAERLVSLTAMAGFIAALAVEVCFGSGAASFGGMLGASSNFGLFVLACSLLTALMSFSYFSKGEKGRSEFIAILMICAAALMLFVRSENLMFSFVSLECATICLYGMAAWSRGRASSIEGAAKYVVAGGVSGAMFLMGTALIYGASLSTGRPLLEFSNFSHGLINPMFVAGLVLVCGGVLFKISAFPFQFWSPDVYQGSPTPVSAFFAVASKGAGIVFLGKICMSLDFASMGLAAAQDKAVLAVSAIAAMTIIVGNLGGITQTNVKRLLAFSGIANAGYMLVLVAAVLKYSGAGQFFEPAVYFYLAAYMFANYGLFFVVNGFKGSDDYDQSMSDYRGLVRKSPVMASTLIINLSSLAGIPPTAGFFGKVLVIILAWYAQMYWLIAVMLAGSAVSIYYYFSWMRATLDIADGGEREIGDNVALAPTMVALSAATLLFGFSILYFIGL